MDPVVNQLARDLVDAIAAVVAEDPRVEACREKAREAGYELTIALEASIGFVNSAPGRSQGDSPRVVAGVKALPPAQLPLEMTSNDRRFLKSLRISADETTEKEVE